MSDLESVTSENRRLRKEVGKLRLRVNAFERSRWWRLHPRFLSRRLVESLPLSGSDGASRPHKAAAETSADARHPLVARFREEVVARGHFTTNWVSSSIPIWEPIIQELEGRESSILEIGSFEGRSACYFLWRLPDARVTCVDTFDGSPEHFEDGLPVSHIEEIFDRNVALVDASRARKLMGASRRVLADLMAEPGRFDLVYVDGSHHALDVLVDASLSWQLLVPHGVMIFDDYDWVLLGNDRLLRPGPAIDAFLDLVKGRCELLHRGHQVMVRRTA